VVNPAEKIAAAGNLKTREVKATGSRDLPSKMVFFPVLLVSSVFGREGAR
jgi:hypothetical protein